MPAGVKSTTLLAQQRETNVQIALQRRKFEPHALSDMGDDPLALRDCLRIHVTDRVRKNASRNVIKDTWLDDLNTREHQRCLGRDRPRWGWAAGEMRNA